MDGIRIILMQRRKTLQISESQLAKKACVSYAVIKKFESGEKISEDALMKIAQGLGYTLERNTIVPETLAKFVPYKLPKGVTAGDKVWKWTVLGPSKKDKHKHAWILCECECKKHTLRYVDWGRLSQNKSTSCGCDRTEKIAAADGVKPDVSAKYDGQNLANKRYNDEQILALNMPPRFNDGHWEWMCQCQIHDVQPRYISIEALESGEIKGCGCYSEGLCETKDIHSLARERFGFIKVLPETRMGKKGLEYKCRCVSCRKTKWVLATSLLKHEAISCNCIPKNLVGRQIGSYRLLDKAEHKDENGYPELRCEKEDGKVVYVRKELLWRTLANELREKKWGYKQDY